MTDRVTISHVRAAGYCLRGVRRHCATLGVDFRQLVRGGIPISEIEDMDDAVVQEIIRRARGDE